MRDFAQKVKDARSEKGYSQQELADLAGLSIRTILSYEKGEKKPRQGNLLKLAKALEVSTKFLIDDTCDNAADGIDDDGYIERARQEYALRSARETRDVRGLLEQTTALLAGGEISDSEKDEFFCAVMEAYLAARHRASEKFSPKKPSDE